MITREQVADLQPGDVVEMSWRTHDDEVEHIVRGPLHTFGSHGLRVGEFWILDPSTGRLIEAAPRRTLTVVSRAPRPLYVNHPRTEPVAGDVVAHPEPDNSGQWQPTWFWNGTAWRSTRDGGAIFGEMPRPMRLLIDGETGQVVQ